MKSYKKIFFGLSVLIIAYASSLESFSLRESYAWFKSLFGFHISLYYNRYWLKQDVCSFQCILAPYKAVPTRRVVIGPQNNILLIADGLHAPLYLGKIPESIDYFINLRMAAGFRDNHGQIALHTLNRAFEQRFVHLQEMIEEDGEVTQYNYSTTDFTAPSLIDLIRGVYNLKARDRRGEKIALVHCKAGRGRSAALVIAYLLYVYSTAEKVNLKNVPYTPKELVHMFPSDETLIEALEAYVKQQRSVIGLHAIQRDALIQFYRELKKYGTFENLYEHYSDEIHDRDVALKTPYTQMVTQP